jgi:Ca2+-binding RTX toxin-like protein
MASVDRVEPPSGTPVAWLMRRPVTVQGSNSHLIQFRNNSSGETAMAIFDMSKNTGSGVEMWKCLGLLFTVGAPGAVTYGTIGAQSSTGYDILYGPNGGPVPSKVHFGGTGFTYPTATSSAMTGTVKNLSLSASWDSTTGVQANIAVTGLSMSISNFFLTTGGQVQFEAMNALLAGDDTVIGSAFDDVLTAGSGNNTINGGVGSDTVSYEWSSAYNLTATHAGVTVDLNAGTSQVLVLF